MRILFLVITTAKYHDTRVRAILNTWAKDLQSNIYFFTDGPGTYPQLVNLRVSSDYHSASLKTVLALIHAWTYLGGQQSEWVMISDDDTFIYTDRLYAFAKDQQPNEGLCFGNKLKLYPDLPDLNYPSGGAGYLVSHRALAMLQSHLHQCRLYPFSDVTIGTCLQAAGVPIIDVSGFHSQPPEYYFQPHTPELPESIRHALTFHYIKPERMIDLYDDRFRPQTPSTS